MALAKCDNISGFTKLLIFICVFQALDALEFYDVRISSTNFKIVNDNELHIEPGGF